jgi:hypothetical protein
MGRSLREVVKTSRESREGSPIMIGEMTLEEAACEVAGNWKSWSCFVWDREQVLDDAENWSIVYTHNRDSGLLACSNAEAIARVLKSFAVGDDPDLVFESHSHWAVGHVDGFSIRVYFGGAITDAFRAYHGESERLAEYPILDETDYAEKELEATLENIADAAWRLKGEYELPDG